MKPGICLRFFIENEMEIKILGPGCAKCKTLDKLTREVVEKNGINAKITKVEDIMEIMKYGVMSTPALVIDEKVVLKGRVPSSDELKQLLTK
jgi:small redox-active disulfide protein 2